MGRVKEPILWALFSGGGMVAALVLPALVFLLWIAAPLGWVTLPSYGELVELVRHPISRLSIFALASLSFYHWAHRFRYTLYDGLQLYHLNELIAVLTYGSATLLTLAAGFLLVAVV
ncbi:MAG: fumarate reductase subunit D [Gemmatimonadetes bacterium]|uniref:Fumarate reductase subunit D n=1 Tax=Candidatus Kutchimonas denitrificans TaxID=3056748 RepID=A0AAE4ZB53_9BACT|nr:fumarate reductase subunit D [Gemmatimonadota bacterium]NIR75937.1 fumarate reductase subunit D [Candidatus Kutchimonas denitrificans]NIS02095.1 fumarate reductase subunit D [Gemmatimonadota bacterium]NIT67920.1 fumarate reductase subunit D [Gemmatimonadota bacterium]NIU53914.1 fumarate reductase subunit D [Gemmatimonadota bacterium]